MGESVSTTVPLFDSCTHPTLNGEWTSPIPAHNMAEQLIKEMDEAVVERAIAIGLPGVGSYDETLYVRAMSRFDGRLLPVACVDRDATSESGGVSGLVRHLKALGYLGVKIHPRRQLLPRPDALMVDLIRRSADSGLTPFVCTYTSGGMSMDRGWRIEEVADLLENLDGTPLVLLHGGGVRLLEMSELARAYPNTLLDLSFTLLKYEGSSLDADLRFLFSQFDRRLCIGSDSPEFGPSDLRRRFEQLCAGLPLGKAEGIARGNLQRFMKAISR